MWTPFLRGIFMVLKIKCVFINAVLLVFHKSAKHKSEDVILILVTNITSLLLSIHASFHLSTINHTLTHYIIL